VKFRTSENLWDMKTLPKRFVILGGGPIGCEMTQAFQRLGSQVTQVEMFPRILPREDDDVASIISKILSKEGVDLKTDTKALEVVSEAGVKTLICEGKEGGRINIPFDEILLAVGRRANSSGMNLERLGIALNNNGTVKVDEYLRANGDNIYACGDLSGPYQFTHTASHQAWYCAVNALLSPFKRFRADYRVVPWVTFTDPEVAQVGHNEQSAKAQGLNFETATYDMADSDRAIAESLNHGQVKVLTEKGKDKIIGANIVSHNAGEMITEFVTAMKYGLSLGKIQGTIHSYPTFSEANSGVAGVWKKAHKPEALLRYVEKFHAMRR
jgi:pyruvate/2-oxoglutarate dehydrogenase complex dihydrolipoamide dehydrogenase (E3) component